VSGWEPEVMMRGNLAMFGVVIGAIASIVTVSLSAHIYRWEVIEWQLIAATMAVLGWGYSRRPRP
jgi:hypothetical protein